MRLGLDSYSYHLAFGAHPDFDPPTPWTTSRFVDRVAELELDGFQLDPMHVSLNQSSDWDAIRQQADRYGLFVECGLMDVTPDSIRTGIRMALHLGAPVIRSFIGFDRNDATVNPEQELERARFQIQECLPELEQADLHLAIENHGEVTSQELVELVKALGHPRVGICLDFGNMIAVAENPIDAVRSMAPYTVSTHIKDYRATMTFHGCDYTGVALGAGSLPVREMLTILLQTVHLDRLVLEIPSPALPHPEEALLREDRAIRKSIQTARQWIRKIESAKDKPGRSDT
jgi:sugar phosphate isomerase/epimerase